MSSGGGADAPRLVVGPGAFVALPLIVAGRRGRHPLVLLAGGVVLGLALELAPGRTAPTDTQAA